MVGLARRNLRRSKDGDLQAVLLADEARKRQARTEGSRERVDRLESRTLYGREQRRLQRGATRAARAGVPLPPATPLITSVASTSETRTEEEKLPFFDFRTTLAEEQTQKDDNHNLRQRLIERDDCRIRASHGEASSSHICTGQDEPQDSQESSQSVIITVYEPFAAPEEAEDDAEDEGDGGDLSSSRIDIALLRNEREARRKLDMERRAEAVVRVHSDKDGRKDTDGFVQVQPIMWRGRRQINDYFASSIDRYVWAKQPPKRSEV